MLFLSLLLVHTHLPSSCIPFLCSPDQKVEVETSLPAFGGTFPILPCSFKRYGNPKLVSLYITNLTHVSQACQPPISISWWLCAFMLLLPLNFATMYRNLVMTGTLQLGAQSLTDLSILFPVLPNSVAWGRAHHWGRSQETSSTVNHLLSTVQYEEAEQWWLPTASFRESLPY